MVFYCECAAFFKALVGMFGQALAVIGQLPASDGVGDTMDSMLDML
jgi:hypothetical protein